MQHFRNFLHRILRCGQQLLGKLHPLQHNILCRRNPDILRKHTGERPLADVKTEAEGRGRQLLQAQIDRNILYNLIERHPLRLFLLLLQPGHHPLQNLHHQLHQAKVILARVLKIKLHQNPVNLVQLVLAVHLNHVHRLVQVVGIHQRVRKAPGKVEPLLFVRVIPVGIPFGGNCTVNDVSIACMHLIALSLGLNVPLPAHDIFQHHGIGRDPVFLGDLAVIIR